MQKKVVAPVCHRMDTSGNISKTEREQKKCKASETITIFIFSYYKYNYSWEHTRVDFNFNPNLMLSTRNFSHFFRCISVCVSRFVKIYSFTCIFPGERALHRGAHHRTYYLVVIQLSRNENTECSLHFVRGIAWMSLNCWARCLIVVAFFPVFVSDALSSSSCEHHRNNRQLKWCISEKQQ